MSSNAKKGRKEGREEGRKEGRKEEKVNACASFEGPSNNRGAEGVCARSCGAAFADRTGFADRNICQAAAHVTTLEVDLSNSTTSSIVVLR